MTTRRSRVTLRAVFCRARRQSSISRYLGVAVSLALQLGSVEALADRDLWQSPATCPAPEGLRRPPSPAAGPSEPRRAWVVVSQTESGWAATIHAEYEGGKGTRVLTASSCEAVRSAALLALSLLDPESVAPAPSPSPSPAASTAPAVGSTPTPEPQTASERSVLPEAQSKSAANTEPVPVAGQAEPAPIKVKATPVPPRPPRAKAAGTSAAPRRRRFSAGLGIAAGSQALQLPMLGFALDLTGRVGAWRGRVELGLRTTVRAIATEDQIKVNLLLASARLEGCRAWLPGALELSLCAGPLLQRLQGSAATLSSPGEAVWLPGFGATAQLKWALRERVSLWGATQLDARYHRVDYEVDERGEVGSFGRLSAVLLAGPEVRF